MTEPHPQLSRTDGSFTETCSAGWRDDSGQDLVEYALLLLLVALVLIGTLTLFGGQITAIYESFAASLTPGG